ncbi:proline racemase family protein [Clostridium sp. Marseille-P2415]|nr:proline racemase family protein [Clostridium sp. Marseille-P2415]
MNEPFYNEGLLGVTFTGKAIEKTEIHGHKAIVPTVGGQCWIYGFSE